MVMLELLGAVLSECLTVFLECRIQVSDSSLFELSRARVLRGTFAMTGSRVGRQAHIIATLASMRLQSRKIVKSSVVVKQDLQ